MRRVGKLGRQVCRQQSRHDMHQAENQRKPKCPDLVASTEAQIASREQERTGEHGAEHHKSHHRRRGHTAWPSWPGERVGAPWLEDLEVDRRAPPGRGFDADGDVGPIRIRAGPRRPRVGKHRRDPPRGDRGERRGVESGFAKQRRPVGGCCCALRLLESRRHGLQEVQAAFQIEHHVDHAGDTRRRVVQRHDAAQHERVGRQCGRRLPIPERHAGRLARSQPLVARRGLIVSRR